MDGFTLLKDLLPKAANAYGMQREVRAALVRDRARQSVRDIWGGDASEITPLYFKDGILTVEVGSSAWGREVFLNKERLIKLIEEDSSLSDVIKDVKTKLVG